MIDTIDLDVLWHREAFRLTTRRIVESDRNATEILTRWADRWCRRRGHIRQPEIEVLDLSFRPEYWNYEGVILGVAWRYLEHGARYFGGRGLVVRPGVNALRVPVPPRHTTASSYQSATASPADGCGDR